LASALIFVFESVLDEFVLTKDS